MWSKLLAIAVCVFAIAIGLWFVSIGTFAASLTGYCVIAMFSIIMSFNIYDLVEQNVNRTPEVLTQNFFDLHAYRLALWAVKNPTLQHPITVRNAQAYIDKWAHMDFGHKPYSPETMTHEEALEVIVRNPKNFTPEDHAEAVKELAMIKELNTPDPHLIHPDLMPLSEYGRERKRRMKG